MTGSNKPEKHACKLINTIINVNELIDIKGEMETGKEIIVNLNCIFIYSYTKERKQKQITIQHYK